MNILPQDTFFSFKKSFFLEQHQSKRIIIIYIEKQSYPGKKRQKILIDYFLCGGVSSMLIISYFFVELYASITRSNSVVLPDLCPRDESC